jgi:release factor glutamine methyltransferase
VSGTVGDAVAAATARLQAAGVPEAAGDARRLVAHAVGIAPDRLTLHLSEPFAAGPALESALAAREARQPVSQIVGNRLFWGRAFRVTPDVLDPRPETETLVAAALEAPFERVLDLGSGTGCILLTLLAERPLATGIGVDVSEAALAVARENAARLGVTAEFRRSDWFSAVAGTFDLIVANPPYIAAGEMVGLAPEVRDWEPKGALTDGGDGLGAYRIIAAGVAEHLAPGGRLLLEIGLGQGPAVADLLAAAGLEGAVLRPDMTGRTRVVEVRAPMGPEGRDLLGADSARTVRTE